MAAPSVGDGGGRRHGLDGLIVATPPWLHAEIATAALTAGMAVLCEKPLALGVADAKAILRARDSSGAALVVDHVLRYTPLAALLRSLVRGPAGGAVQRVLVENDASDESLPPRHWFWDRARSGGIFVEHAVHFLDLAGDLVGAAPTAVQAMGNGGVANAGEPSGRTDTVVATVRYASGATATQYHSFAHPTRCERQLVRVDAGTFEARLTGWIPWRLEVEAWTDDAGVAAVESVVGDPRIRAATVTTEVTRDAGTAVARSRERDVDIPHRVRLTVDFGGEAAKAGLYRAAVQAAAMDLAACVRDPRRRPASGGEEGLEAVRLACAATRAWDDGSVRTLSAPS